MAERSPEDVGAQVVENIGRVFSGMERTDGCWVVMSSPSPVRATVFCNRADAYQYAYEEHAASVAFVKWGETT